MVTVLKPILKLKVNLIVQIVKKNEIYEVKTQQEYFKLFFIPIWPIDKKTQPFVECQLCKDHFNIDILEDNNFYLDGSSV